MAEHAAADNARCPRCGTAFHCGASETRCDCAAVALDAATRAAIAARYTDCLCVGCLAQLQLEQEGTPP